MSIALETCQFNIAFQSVLSDIVIYLGHQLAVTDHACGDLWPLLPEPLHNLAKQEGALRIGHPPEKNQIDLCTIARFLRLLPDVGTVYHIADHGVFLF